MIRTPLENHRILRGTRREISRCRSQRDHPPQGSVLAPLIFNVYTNDQPIHPGTSSFVYADDLAINAQSKDVAPIEETLTSALVGLSEHYTTHQLSSFVSFTQCSPTCGRVPLPSLSLWPGRQPYRPRLVGDRRGGGPSYVAPRSRIHRLDIVEIAPSPHRCFRTANPCAQSVNGSPAEPVLSRSSR